MNLRDRVNKAVARILKQYGHASVSVLIGGDTRRQLLDEATPALTYATYGNKIPEFTAELAGMYLGHPVHFVDWMDGMLVAPKCWSWSRSSTLDESRED